MLDKQENTHNTPKINLKKGIKGKKTEDPPWLSSTIKLSTEQYLTANLENIFK